MTFSIKNHDFFSSFLNFVEKTCEEICGTDRERRIVAVCLSAHRSIPAVAALRDNGYVNACQLQGGMLAWWSS